MGVCQNQFANISTTDEMRNWKEKFYYNRRTCQQDKYYEAKNSTAWRRRQSKEADYGGI